MKLIERLRYSSRHPDDHKAAELIEAQQARIEKLEAVREAAEPFRVEYDEQGLKLDAALTKLEACKEGE